MPDPLKLKVLADAGYILRATCGSCENGLFPALGATFGSCERLAPTRAKHTEGARISIRRDGWCPAFRSTPFAVDRIEQAGMDRFAPDELRRCPIRRKGPGPNGPIV